ncbi:MAG: Sau3AI family type II restriction endonuclease [Patescibacteria group bacterium]|jgi:DNA mismatch repair protein MutH
MNYDQTDPKSIEAYAQELLGHSLREKIAVDLPDTKRAGKGGFGQDLEEYYFKISPGNISAPDFTEAGVELKSFPIDQRKNNKLVAGERIKLGSIDYEQMATEEWETSSFLKKNALLLLVAYLRDRRGSRPTGFDYRDALIRLAHLWDYPDGDLKIIRDDWNLIVEKVRGGRAHEISEGDTLYLGAATSGQKGSKLRKQPRGPDAKQRSLTLKQPYVTTILERLLAPRLARKELEPAVKASNAYRGGETFEEYIARRFKTFIGMTTDEINAELQLILDPSAKNYIAVLTRAILGVRKKKIEEFEKAGVLMKTIRLERHGAPKESMSFPAFRYNDLIAQTWDDSDLRRLFQQRFFFVVFQRNESGRLVLKKVLFWTMPTDALEGEVKKVWEKTVKMIKAGRIDDLPRESESPVCHVRPHARNAADTDIAPDGKRYVRKCFWLNRKFIADIVAASQSN